MKTLVTAKTKDQILNLIVEQCELGIFQNADTAPIGEKYNLSVNQVAEIISTFQNEGLVSEYRGLTQGSFVNFVVRERAHLKLSRGGYQLEELILIQELDKLNMEIKNLQAKVKPEDLSAVTSVVANLSTILAQVFQY